MMIILLYSAAILIKTILLVNYLRLRLVLLVNYLRLRLVLLVNYLRLRLVEVRLPEPCSSLVKHLNIFYGNINNKSFER